MAKNFKQERRDFLKASAAGAAALSLGGILPKQARAAPLPGLAWVDGMQINPFIDNLRVVAVNDPAMIGAGTTGTFQSLNEHVNSALVGFNLDKMAMALADKTDAKTAWINIFQKPAGKTWSQVQVAIKVNCLDDNDQPRLAILDKICRVLNAIGTTGDPGVPYENITIFDPSQNCSGFYGSAYSKSKLPAGVVAANGLGGSRTVTLPGGNTTLRAGRLMDGTVDILINMAVNKGHDQADKGHTTLTLKNHYGTFITQPSSYPRPDGCANLSYLTDINKSVAIVGGTPVRQQLCIVDSLWAMVNGPSNGTLVPNNRLIMGTFSGAVDYLVARKIREGVMRVTNQTSSAIDGFLTSFGYSLTSGPAVGLDIVDALAWYSTAVVEKRGAARGPATLFLKVSRRGKTPYALFHVTPSSRPATLKIYSLSGQTIAELAAPSLAPGRTAAITWNGRTAAGRNVPAGTYIVKVISGASEMAGSITIGE